MNDIDTKPNLLTRAKNVVASRKTEILVVTNVATLAVCVLMKSGIAQHNAFLKEHGLYEQFYDLATPEA